MQPEHFSERFGLFVLIALGESVVAIGAGAEATSRSASSSAVLGVVLAAGLWWTYFDVVSIIAPSGSPRPRRQAAERPRAATPGRTSTSR
jgi:low temperature requirement protein LtrA